MAFGNALVVATAKLLLHIKATITKQVTQVLLDSGASHSLISIKTCNKYGLDVKNGEPVYIKLANGSTVNSIGTANAYVNFGNNLLCKYLTLQR